MRFREAAFLAGAVLRFRVAAAFFPAAVRFGDFREVGRERDVVRFREVAAFRAVRFLVAAAFLPAATRFGDLRDVDFRAVVRFREVAAFRFREVAAFRAVRFRVAADFLPAATRFGDFRDVDFRAVERFRVAADFFPAATRFGDFRDVDFRAVERFRVAAALRAAVVRFLVAAAFFPAATRFGDLLDVARFRAGDFDARDVVLRFVASRDRSPPGGAVGAGGGITVVSIGGVGRSHAGVSGCQDGSGALGASSADPSRSSRSCVASEPPSRSSQGQSRVLRSGGVISEPPPRRSRRPTGSEMPYPDSRASKHAGATLIHG